jgi:sugar phosphate isomerase/epimerase
MGDIKLAGAAWSFVGVSLTESADIWRALGIHAMDLIAVPGALLDSHEIDRDPQGQARRVNDTGMEISNLLYVFGAGFHDRPVNSADAAVRAQNMETFKRVLEFCAAARIPSVLMLPGVGQPGISHAEAMRLSAEALNAMTDVAAEAGVLLVFEPHLESVLQNLSDTFTFLGENPHLKIALDYGHFVAQGYKPHELDPLAPYAGHVHLRQCADKQLQARWDDGVIDIPAMVGVLKEAGYQGYLALEYEHDPWMGCDKIDVMTESIKMRNLVRPLLSGG